MTEPNYSTIRKMSQGDREFEMKILSVASQELTEEVREFSRAMKETDYAQAAQLVHKIKHKVSLLGMEKSYEITQEFEEQLKMSRKALLPDFEDILKKMFTFLNESVP